MSDPELQELVSERVMWLLENKGEQIKRGRLRDILHIRMAVLDPFLDEMEKEGKIRITSAGPRGWYVQSSGDP